MSEYLQSTAMLVHIAALLQVVGYLLRDQIRLRLMLLAGSIIYCVYYVAHPQTPLWDAMAWSLIMAVANTVLIIVIWHDRRTGVMTPLEQAVYQHLGMPLPGHFRRIMRIARSVETNAPVTLTTLGTHPEKLYFVYRGTVLIERDSGPIWLNSASFIGEIALVLGRAASATASLPNGGCYLEWDRRTLDKLLEQSNPIRTSFQHLLTRDLARKLCDQGDTPNALPA